MSRSSTNIDNSFPEKYCLSLLHSVGAIYHLACCSGQKHLGQTKRNLITRLKEH